MFQTSSTLGTLACAPGRICAGNRMSRPSCTCHAARRRTQSANIGGRRGGQQEGVVSVVLVWCATVLERAVQLLAGPKVRPLACALSHICAGSHISRPSCTCRAARTRTQSARSGGRQNIQSAHKIDMVGRGRRTREGRWG
jgi:hypothetical protein